MCYAAHLPMVLSNGTSMRVVCILPAVVSESLIGLGHTMHFFLTLHSVAGVVHRVQQLAGDALGQGLLAALAREVTR